LKLTGKNILLISPEPWDHIFVSKHHYAIHLARRGNKVFFLNPPGESEGVRLSGYENVVSVHYAGFPKGLRFYPGPVQRRVMRDRFLRLQGLCDTRFDIVWSFDNSVFFDFTAFPEDVFTISHIVDLNQNFQLEKAAATARICFATTEQILANLLPANSRSFKINHGFSSHTPDAALSLPGKAEAKVLYAGNLAMPYIDWSVLHAAVTENSEVDFVFVGPDNPDQTSKNRMKQEVFDASNVHCVGRVPSERLQEYYRAADVLIISYQERYHSDQANPHKMMEYLGSGKVVVATFTGEYEALNASELIVMSGSNHEFPTKLKQVLANLHHWNADSKQELRKQFAQANTYDAQLNRIETLIGHNP